MKRRDLIRRIEESAKNQGLSTQFTEGAHHTKVVVGSRFTFIPRHREIAEGTARILLKTLSTDQEGAS
jgi:mRNA interferase HicA